MHSTQLFCWEATATVRVGVQAAPGEHETRSSGKKERKKTDRKKRKKEKASEAESWIFIHLT